MSKYFDMFLATADCEELWDTRFAFLKLKRGRIILVKTPYTKRGTPDRKAQKHLLYLGVKKGVFW